MVGAIGRSGNDVGGDLAWLACTYAERRSRSAAAVPYGRHGGGQPKRLDSGTLGQGWGGEPLPVWEWEVATWARGEPGKGLVPCARGRPTDLATVQTLRHIPHPHERPRPTAGSPSA